MRSDLATRDLGNCGNGPEQPRSRMKATALGAERSKRRLQKPRNIPPADFVKGQIWKTPEGYVVITQVGKLLIHYRLGTRPGMFSSPSRISTKEEVRTYLERTGGVQVQSDKQAGRM